MQTLILLLLASVAAVAQDTTVKITGNGPRGSASTALIVYKSALVTFGVASGTIDGTGVVVLPVAINNKTGQLATALQFDFSYATAEVSGVTFALGPAAVAAGKTLACSAQFANTQRCIMSGGQTGIADGVVVLANIQTSLTSQATTTVTLLGTLAANIGGSAVNTALAPGGGAISMPPLLASVSCGQPDIWGGISVQCTAALNKPALPGGASVALASDSSLVAVPGSLTIPEGATSVPFTAVGQ